MGIIQRQGIRNTFVTYFGIMIGFLNLIVLQPYLLKPEEIGLIRVLFSFSSLIAVMLPLGATSVTIRFFPLFREQDKQHHGFFGFILLFPLIGFVVSSVFLFVLKDFFIAQYINNSKLFTEYYNYVIPFSFILGLITVLNTYSFSLFRTTIPSVLNDIFARLGTMAVISAYYLQLISLQFFVIYFIGVSGIQLIVLVIYIFKIDKPKIIPNVDFLKKQNLPEIFGYGLLVSLASISSLGLKYIDAIMIGKYMSLSFVGVYTIAAFIPALIEAPIASLEKISTTKIASALAIDNMQEIKEIYFKSCRYLFLLGGWLFLGININISALLHLLPEAYHGGGKVVLLISLGALLNMLAGANSSIIFSSKHYKFGAFLLVFIAVLAFLFNVLLIPMFGMEGAALATLLSTFIYALMRFVFIRVKFKLMPYDIKTILTALLILICFLINHLIPELNSPIADILMRSVIITVLYFSGTFLLKIVPEFHMYIPGIAKRKNPGEDS